MVTQKYVKNLCYLICLRQIRYFYTKMLILLHACATYSDLPSTISTMKKQDYLSVYDNIIEKLRECKRKPFENDPPPCL